MTGNLKDTWKMIRGVIFQHIFDYATLPRESASSFKAGFFDIILKPMIRIMERNEVVLGDQDQTEYIRQAVRKALVTWRDFEPNLGQRVINVISEVYAGSRWLSSADWVELMRYESGERLLKGRNSNDDLGKRLASIFQPNVVLNLSNAPIHEMESRMEGMIKGDSEAYGRNYDRTRLVIYRLVMVRNFLEMSGCSSDAIDEVGSVETVIEKYTMMECHVRNKAGTIEDRVVKETKDLMEEVENKIMVGLPLTLPRSILKLHEAFRISVGSSTKQKIKEAEILFEILRLMEKDQVKVSMKRRPGRPKKQAGNCSSAQMKITDFTSNKLNN
jgi:hypothetical protein